MDFSNLFDPEFLKQLLSTSGKASLTEKLLIVGAVWLVMGRKVAAHFKSLEAGMLAGFEKLSERIGEVRGALAQVESSHTHKIEALDARVVKLEAASDKPEEPVRPLEPPA